MSYLLPQFKCLPDTFSFHSRTLLLQPSSQPSKHREPTNFQAQCMLSITSLSPPTSITTTTMIDMEKLRLLSSDAHSNSSVAERPWTYVDTAQPIEISYRSSLPKENLLTSEEAIIAAASAEAVALAKAAARFAKNAAMSHNSSTDIDDSPSVFPSHAETFMFNRGPQVGSREPITAATVSGEMFPQQCHVNEAVDTQPLGSELELLQERIANSPVMRSKRQKERKTRRAKATEKDAANVVSVKSGSTRRKKRPSVQDVDYSDPLRHHRGTASSKLLTATEEQELSKGIQEMIKVEKLQDELAHRCGVQPTFAQWAAAAGVDKKTLRKRISYGTICRDRMVKSNIRLVISIAKNYQGAGMNLQDLVQEGCRGLLRGAEKFDATKGFKFSTYAHWWIKQAVRKSLSDQSRTIRLPIHMVEATYRVKEARKQLYAENGSRHPNNEEVAKAAGLSMKKFQAVLLTPKAPRSLDQKIGFNMDLRPSDVISDPEAETSEELLIKQFMRQDLDKVLNTLTPRENQVIRWRFGLEDSRLRTLQEIGELLGVSRERIRQIETSAFRKLKNKRRTKNLQQYLISHA